MRSRSRGAVDWGELGALFLLGLVALAWLFDWDPLSSTVTVYPLLCSLPFHDTQCRGELHSLATITYKASERRQEVIYLRGDGRPPQRLANCVVWSGETWACDGPPDALIDRVTAMRDGQLRGGAPLFSSEVISAPKWRWWLVRLKEKLPVWLERLQEFRNWLNSPWSFLK